MSKLRLIRLSHLEALKSNIGKNLEGYRNADMSVFPDPQQISFEIDIDGDLDALADLLPSRSHEHEVENCLTVFKSFSGISPELARDERLWVYVTHYHALTHATSRWPIPEADEDAHKTISTHYFAGTKRSIERDNVISRLWWMAYIASKAKSGSHRSNLDALLQFSDVRAAVVERPTVSRSSSLLTAVLERLRDAHIHYQETGEKGLFDRHTFRALMKQLNSVGGHVLLDCLEQSQLHTFLSKMITESSP